MEIYQITQKGRDKRIGPRGYPWLEMKHINILDSLREEDKTINQIYEELAEWGCHSLIVLLKDLDWLRHHQYINSYEGVFNE